MDNPTVVVLNDFCHVQGGASKVAIDEARFLAEAGCNVIFLGAAGPISDMLRHPAIKTICLHQPELLQAGRRPGVALQALWNRVAWKTMRDLLRTLDPGQTVVHLHGYTKALSTSPIEAAHNAGFATVCTLHDFFTACPNGAFFDYVQSAPCTRRALSASCILANCDKRARAHKLFRLGRSAIQRIGGFPGGVSHYITLSNRSAEMLRGYLPARARFTPLSNVVETDYAPPTTAASNQTLLHVGRLDEEKGVLILAQAAARTRRAVRFVGDGPLRDALQRYPNVTVTGWVSPAKVQAELTHARALAFPSLWYETYGLVVAEAAARGVPALVSDTTAAAERVRDGVTGWHIRAGDIDAWANAIEALTNDTAVGNAGAAAHEDFWSAPPNSTSHVLGLLAIYRQTLADSAGTPAPSWSRAPATAVSAPQ